MAKRKTEDIEEPIENQEETIKTASSDFLCPNCKYFINNVCEHYSNIKIIIKKRIEKRVYKSLEQKTECDYVEPKA